MVGSLLNDLFKPKLIFILGLASLALGLVTAVNDSLVRFVLFSVFEGCVGAFWPIMAGLRSKYVPENARCAVLSLFRLVFRLLSFSKYLLKNSTKLNRHLAAAELNVDLGHFWFLCNFSVSVRYCPFYCDHA